VLPLPRALTLAMVISHFVTGFDSEKDIPFRIAPVLAVAVLVFKMPANAAVPSPLLNVWTDKVGADALNAAESVNDARAP
jgi:hypothetical protein